jgi:hypothetical protein
MSAIKESPSELQSFLAVLQPTSKATAVSAIFMAADQDRTPWLLTAAASGEFWGVVRVTLNRHGYAWDFESALKDPAQTTGPASLSDKGVGTCHGPVSGGGN